MKKQTDFFQMNRDFAPDRISHGDQTCVGKRKIARPFRRNTSIHLVLKSDRAVGTKNLLTRENRVQVKRIIARQAALFNVKVYSEQNVGNHIHAVLSCPEREGFQNFLRAVTGLIARAVLKTAGGKFWTQVPFTRLIVGRRDFLQMQNYLMKNFVEANLGKAAREIIESAEDLARNERRREKRKSSVRSRIVNYSARPSLGPNSAPLVNRARPEDRAPLANLA